MPVTRYSSLNTFFQ